MDENLSVKTIPVLIKHVKNLKINSNAFGKNLKAFGIGFDNVLIYGTFFPLGVDKKNKLKFRVDDGTGHIGVKLPSTNNDNIALSLELDLQKEKLKNSLVNKNVNQYDADKQQLYESMERLLQKIKTQSILIDSNTKSGTPVAVLGIPYKIDASNEIWIHALDVIVESSPNRDTEIFFKKNLFKWYQNMFIINFL